VTAVDVECYRILMQFDFITSRGARTIERIYYNNVSNDNLNEWVHTNKQILICKSS